MLRELYLSLGCALENLVLAAAPNGMSANVQLLPDPTDAAHVATIALARVTPERSSLFEAIPHRHTNRSAYASRPLPAAEREALSKLVDAPGGQLVWFSSAARKRAFSDLTIRATEAIIADPQ